MTKSRRNPKLKLQNFRNLPSEVIIDIISRLPARSTAICKCVCKSWRDLIRNRELLKNLPPEIVIEILSRLSIRTIGTCKRVRKSWRDLLQTRQFADSHLSKSVQGLVVSHNYTRFHVLAFEDELDLEDPDIHCNPLATFDSCKLFINIFDVKASVNGLLFLHPMSSTATDYYICNPITREFFEFPFEPRLFYIYFYETVNYGFGVSKVTGQYKVVRIVDVMKPICHIYTLGTGKSLGKGKWRRIDPGPPLGKNKHSTGAFLNGCLHWFVEDSKNSNLISCFDLETETFSTFSHPPVSMFKSYEVLVALGDCLCICDNRGEHEIAFWMMKEYGNDESWTKEFVIGKTPELVSDYGQSNGIVCPIKIFKDGHVLMTWEEHLGVNMLLNMFYYSNKTKTTTLFDAYNVFGISGAGSHMDALLFTPSFLSLKSFPNEFVTEFSYFRSH
ncbi:PREDICTED: F-box/kelch-repeat protein At3g06240-like [Erythranthe guttata]|uniref:F-box/kelch-repeat protein At3g06240-like n=1 Tax=Erythranthe guttata TaxID=4155 RepID=UPI00064DFF5B|nr:PREDICTED: F-box/kelch-repeat protein At3g06240-like [Erythranthe guttata]|eukprot:XP_012854989.1 PREDICTED: F-box/kelch-repeat protein At3g06240-like [Erythranthe guttata]